MSNETYDEGEKLPPEVARAADEAFALLTEHYKYVGELIVDKGRAIFDTDKLEDKGQRTNAMLAVSELLKDESGISVGLDGYGGIVVELASEIK